MARTFSFKNKGKVTRSGREERVYTSERSLGFGAGGTEYVLRRTKNLRYDYQGETTGAPHFYETLFAVDTVTGKRTVVQQKSYYKSSVHLVDEGFKELMKRFADNSKSGNFTQEILDNWLNAYRVMDDDQKGEFWDEYHKFIEEKNYSSDAVFSLADDVDDIRFINWMDGKMTNILGDEYTPVE